MEIQDTPIHSAEMPVTPKRKVYEARIDQAKERIAMTAFCQARNVDAVKLPTQTYKVDWLILNRGVPHTWAEVRCRDQMILPFAISLHKYMALQDMMQKTGLQGLIAVQWPQGMFYTKIGKIHEIGWLQKESRTDGQDGEPTVLIPFKEFLPADKSAANVSTPPPRKA